MDVKVLSWNVASLRGLLSRYGTVQKVLETLQADIVCLQEHKLRREDLTLGDPAWAVLNEWHSFFAFSRGSTGYSGTVTYVRRAVSLPVHAEEGLTGVLSLPPGCRDVRQLDPMWHDLDYETLLALDSEGRVLLTDHGGFVLANVYGPCISTEERAEARMQYKLRFYEALERRLSCYLRQGRRVLLAGDLNICTAPIDTAKPVQDMAQFTQRPDRVWFARMLASGGGPFVDTFRLHHPHRTETYSCWSTASSARVNNYGTRIDFVLAAEGGVCGDAAQENSRCWVTNAEVWSDLSGSDHAPVWATIRVHEPLPVDHEPPPLCSIYLFGSGRQASLDKWLLAKPRPAAVAAPAAPPLAASQSFISIPGRATSIGSLAGGSPITAASRSTKAAAGSAVASRAGQQRGGRGAVKGAAKKVPALPVAGQKSLREFMMRPPSGGAVGGTLSSSAPGASEMGAGGTTVEARGPPGCAVGTTSGAAGGTAIVLAGCAGGTRGVTGGTSTTGEVRSNNGQTAGMPATQSPARDAGGTECGASPGAGQQGLEIGGVGGVLPDVTPQQAGVGESGAWCGAHGTSCAAAGVATGIACSSSGIICMHQSLQRSWQWMSADAGVTAGTTWGGSGGGGGVQRWSCGHAESLSVTAPRDGTAAERSTCSAPLLGGAVSSIGMPATSASLSQGLPASAVVAAGPSRGPALAPLFGSRQHQGAAAAVATSTSSASQPASLGTACEGSNAGARAAWKSIQDRMKPPLCAGHKEPSVVRVVKKKGPNNGRVFFVCNRADGPPPHGRCDYFKWATNVKAMGGAADVSAGGAANKKPRVC